MKTACLDLAVGQVRVQEANNGINEHYEILEQRFPAPLQVTCF